MTSRDEREIIDAARVGQDLIGAHRHIFATSTTRCVRCGRSLSELMAKDGEMDKPCEPPPKRLRPLPFGD